MKNVHFAIPEIYGETLSYYELLRKLVNKTNELIENYNTVPEQIAEEVKKLDASQLFSEVLNQLIHSIATDNTKSTNAVKVYKKHDLLYATFNDEVNLYESLIDFSTGTETELVVGSNIREVNISELFIELRKLIDINKNNIDAVTVVANENSAEITTIHGDITGVENSLNQNMARINKAISGKQEILRSGQNIKTINGQTVLGEGNIVIAGNSNNDDTIVDLTDQITYEAGSISGSGVNTDNHTRVRTNFLDIQTSKILMLSINSGFKYGWHLYDENKNHIRSASNFINNSLMLSVSDAYFVRFNFGMVNEAAMTTNDMINSGFSVIAQQVSSNEEGGTENGGYWSHAYTVSTYSGKIQLESTFRRAKYIYRYKPNVSLVSNVQQGMSVYNDKAFLLYNTGGLSILNLKTKETVSAFNLDVANSSNHCNSCNFSNEFYPGNTTYPLLYISECYGQHRCFVENITNENSTLVQTISFDNSNGDYSNPTWGVAFDWILDNETLRLMTYGVMNDGRHKIKVFNKPSISAGDIIFTENDVIEQWVIEDKMDNVGDSYFIYQGNCAKNGTIYLITMNPNKILCIDEITHEITAEVDASFITEEPEDIAVQGENMFIATGESNDSSSIYTLYFY